MTATARWLKADARLKDLYDRGASMREIAEALNAEMGERAFTRNSVIGRLNRLGLRRGGKVAKRVAPPTISIPIKRPATSRRSVKKTVEAVMREAARELSPPVAGGVALIDLGSRQCRFALTERGPHRFCGAGTHGGAWCPEHFRIVYVPKAARAKEIARIDAGASAAARGAPIVLPTGW